MISDSLRATALDFRYGESTYACLGSCKIDCNVVAAMTSAVVHDSIAGLIPTQSCKAADGSDSQHDFSQGK